MSFEFQSTLVNVTPSYRISGSQIGGVRIENNGGIRVARVIVTNDADVKFALSGPYESGDPDAIYATLSADLYELAPGVLLNEGAIGSVEITAEKVIIDLEGSDRKFTVMPDAVVTEPTEVADHTWKITEAGFAALGTAAAAWRSSMDGTLEGLSTAIATETADRIAADSAEASTREADDAALSGRLDTLEADPTTATAVAAGDAATLSSANTYTDTSITNLVNGADAALDTLKEIGDALAQGDSDVTAALTAQITTESTTRAAADTALSGRLDVLEADPTTATAVAAVQSDVDANQTASESADAALSGRLDVLEADPTTATAVAAVQSDVDANQTASEAADSALSGRLDVLEADPTTATAVATVQTNLDTEAGARASADSALDGRLDVLEADPTTATALTDGLALKANKAGDTFTGDVIIDEGTGSTIKLETTDATSAGIHIEGPTGSMGYLDTTNGFGNDSLQVYSANFWVRAINGGTGNVIIDGNISAPNLAGPYSNDADAATNGIAVGSLYYDGNGHVRFRVS